ncbi:MAG: hypothetical protein JXX28_14620 [Deltaproteobacteria bacterium]|nr:hypothetical protein [Deltaproteobacteria bacterium]
MTRTLLLVALLFGVSATPAPAWLGGPEIAQAKNKDEAEKQRLADDIERLTARNHWKGVVRKYEDILALNIPVEVQIHMQAYQAARNIGDISTQARSLEYAVSIETDDVDVERKVREASRALEGIYEVFGKVAIDVGPKRVPALIRPDMPFASEQRSAIEHAQEVLAAEHLYHGLLPGGRYMVDGVFFEVVPGAEVLVVNVR